MLLVDTKSASQPPRVTLEYPEGKTRVCLADNIKRVEEPEEGVGFVYDEVVFFMPDDRSDTLAEIEANFAAWWEYGQEDIKEPSLEDRVSDLESLILAMMEC
jgi:hypothetical protein